MTIAPAGTSAAARRAGPWAWPGIAVSLLCHGLLAACLLLLYARSPGSTRGEAGLAMALLAGGAALIGLALLHQALAMWEIRRLSAHLHDANRRLAACHDEAAANADTLKKRDEELRATHSELRESNRALVEANRRLKTLATTDAQTGLSNHRALIAALDREVERAQRYNRPCTVLFLDLDHFKLLNDTYGHPAGDVMLTQFGAVVRSVLRAVDLIGRWGGEEFVAILPETDRERGLIAAEHVRATVAARAFGNGIHLTCSIGVATYPDDAITRDSLIAMTDQAMYAAKRLGRNQVRAAGDAAVTALTSQTATGSIDEEAALAGTVETLAALVEARDQHSGHHAREVAALTVRLALSLGCPAAEARLIGMAGRLHDVGKIAIPDAILQRPGQLSPEEWALMRTHPTVGADVVGKALALQAVAPVIRAHHEQWDGRGYPDGLAGQRIPLGARIVSVVASYAAMTAQRPYREARSPAEALSELRRCSGTQFDPDVVAALERVLAADPTLADRIGA